NQTQGLALLYPQGLDAQPLLVPLGAQFQVMQQFAAVEGQAADRCLAQVDAQRQPQLRQPDRSRLLVGRRSLLVGRKHQLHLLHRQALDAQAQLEQAAQRPVQLRSHQGDTLFALGPLQVPGLPVAGQTALETLYLQAGHLPEQPAAAGGAAQQHRQSHDQQQTERQQSQQAPFEQATHNSGPMEKCRRTPPVPSSGCARSRRSGPTGETQRMPKPMPLFNSGISSELKALPWSAKVARRQVGVSENWYSPLTATM